jgi:hypothetical protein
MQVDSCARTVAESAGMSPQHPVLTEGNIPAEPVERRLASNRVAATIHDGTVRLQDRFFLDHANTVDLSLGKLKAHPLGEVARR